MEQTLLSTDAVRHALDGQRFSGSVVKMAREFVSTLYKKNGSGNHYYHTYIRAHEIVGACKKIARSTGLTDAEREILLLAAWFIDSGHITTDQEPKTTT
ncbi:hypothetical protein [Spirosoma arcticum]